MHPDRNVSPDAFNAVFGVLSGMPNMIKQGGFSGSVVLEQWPQPPELLVQARKRLQEMIAREAALT